MIHLRTDHLGRVHPIGKALADPWEFGANCVALIGLILTVPGIVWLAALAMGAQ